MLIEHDPKQMRFTPKNEDGHLLRLCCVCVGAANVYQENCHETETECSDNGVLHEMHSQSVITNKPNKICINNNKRDHL